MSSFQEVANQFVPFYYDTFDNNRPNLAALYRDHSMLTFESTSTQGAAQITQKLVELPFQKIQHRVDTMDAQPSNENGGVLVLVSGVLLTDEEQRPMSYTQTFQLLPDQGSYYILNDMFKLIYAAST